MPVEKWWNDNKNNIYWSGSIVGLSWHELWDEAKTEILALYASAFSEE